MATYQIREVAYPGTSRETETVHRRHRRDAAALLLRRLTYAALESIAALDTRSAMFAMSEAEAAEDQSVDVATVRVRDRATLYFARIA